MTRELRRVAVIGGMRIPFCRSNTLYADLSNLDMADGGAERPGRSLRSPGRAHRRGGRRRRCHPFEGLQPGARGRSVFKACAFDARRYADSGLRHVAAIGADVGGQDCERRDRKCNLPRLRYDVGRADRVLEEILEASRRARPTEGGARQDEGVQGAVAQRAGAAAAERRRAAHGTFYGSALRADGAGMANSARRTG